jgi:hypothetical protein
VTTNEAGSELRSTEVAQEQYPVNLRFTIPFYPKSIFVSLIIGRERRSDARLRQERVKHPLDTWGNFTFAFFSGVMVSIAMLFFAMLLSRF